MAQLESFRLKVFRTVAEDLNFRKASERLFLTQPAVTLQIKALENDLGVRLFDRSAGRVTLTRQGGILLGFANRMAAIAADAERKLGSHDGQVSGLLPLGTSTTIGQYVLPRLLGAFLADNPRVRFSLRSGNTSEIVQLLLADRISIGLIEGPARTHGVIQEPFMTDELVLIASPKTSSDRLTREDFLASNLLMREQGSGSRRVVELALTRAGYRLRSFQSVLDMDSTESIKSAVEAGLGIGFVSRWAVSKELELGALKIVSVPKVNVARHFSLVRRTGPEPHGAPAAFRLFALERARLLADQRDRGSKRSPRR
jgi:DNA-binding transcriptional LysR family regulator